MCFEIRKLNSKYLASSAQQGLVSMKWKNN